MGDTRRCGRGLMCCELLALKAWLRATDATSGFYIHCIWSQAHYAANVPAVHRRYSENARPRSARSRVQTINTFKNCGFKRGVNERRRYVIKT